MVISRGFMNRPFNASSAVLAAALVSVVWTSTSAARQQQQQPPPVPTGLPRQYPYPVIRDQRGAVPPGPRPLPSPPLGDGPWTWPTLEQRDIKVSVVTK